MATEEMINGFLNNDFLQNLLLVIIPVIITVFGSKIIVNSWQMQKEKTELRKKILEEFDESYPKLGQHMFEIFYKIRYSYVDLSKIQYDILEESDEVIDFPNDVANQPLAKFGHIFQEMQKEHSKFNSAITKFLSSITLYFIDNWEIAKECVEIEKYELQLYKLLHQIVYCKNKTDFISLCKKYVEINRLQYQKINFVKIMLVYEKIQNPEKGMNTKFFDKYEISDEGVIPKSKTKYSSPDRSQQSSEP